MANVNGLQEAPPAKLAVSDPNGWRPIETAPKDTGPLFLGVVRRGRLEEVHVGFFSHAYNEDEENCWWSEQSDDEITPSVWMPFIDIGPECALPPPPAAQVRT